eukprot:m51a1_g132 hypothetical protein (436) ;mRNA; f:439179-441126
MEDRYFTNPFQEGPLPPLDIGVLRETREGLISSILSSRGVAEDPYVYEGASGIAMGFLHAAAQNENVLLSHSRDYADIARGLVTARLAFSRSLLRRWLTLPHRGTRHHLVSLFTGDAGVHAVCAAVYRRVGMRDLSSRCVDELLALEGNAERESSNELLYGRAGYLQALLFCERYVGRTEELAAAKCRIVQQILDSGEARACDDPSGWPLMYSWHGTRYVGAAHGLCGIAHSLLLGSSGSPPPVVKQFVGRIASLQSSSGSFPSSLDRPGHHEVVQWCHGSPGLVTMLCEAHAVYGRGHETPLLEGARRSCEDIWRRGLLRKGYGLCHGISGNAYAMLRLWRETGDRTWLDRARAFASLAARPPEGVEFEFSTKQENLFNGAGGPTRDAMRAHEALQGNMADVSAKDGSQEAAVNILGMLLGLGPRGPRSPRSPR